jgi:DNA-binding transcriptional regulator YhcF (GntR family)
VLLKELTKPVIVFSAIKEKINKNELVSGDRLSSVKKLAVEFRVSEFTIIKAFDLLEKENLITRVKNSGVFIGIKNKNETISCKNIPAKTRAQEIADSFVLQIIQGTMKLGEYMTLNKALAFKYATSNKTIKKVIEILLDKKFIHKDGFRYVIGQQTASTLRTAKKRVYILVNQELADWKYMRGYNRTFFQSFEYELQKHSVISFEYLNLWNEPDVINKTEEAATAGFLTDFLFLMERSDEPEKLLTNFKKTAELVRKKNLPFVVDSYNGILRYVPDFALKSMSNIFLIGHDDFEAGEKIGTYLASMGHKQIAYFCFGNVSWNMERFKGVECGIKRYFNSGSNIHYFRDDSDDYDWHADLSTYKGTSKGEKNRFLEAYSGLFNGYQFQKQGLIEEAYPTLANLIYEDIRKKRMYPFFEKALKMKEITAWVGTGPGDTVAAAEFLMEQKINIPNEISVIGFGAIDNALGYEITVFDFMESKAGYLAAHCILGDIPIKKNRKGYVEYEGQMMVRKSVKAI